MKRFPIFLLCLLLLAVPALAAAPPVIDAVTPDCMIPADLPAPELRVSAHCEEGGTLLYQWYTAETADASALTRIDGAQDAAYIPPVLTGERYYCVEVRCSHDGALSEAVFSRLISVCFEAPWYDLVIVSLPDKLDYLAGETPDLTGLRVRIQDADLTFETTDGAHLEYSNAPLTVGTQEIVLRYGDATTSFFVTVRTDASHVHTYPDGWVVVKAPGCEEAGEQRRICPCGASEQMPVPAAGHVWDDGHASSRGIKYICTVCGATYTQKSAHQGSAKPEVFESTAPGSDSDVSTAPTDSEPEAASSPQNPSAAQAEHYTPAAQTKRVTLQQRKPWKLIAIAAIVFACCAALAFLLLRNKKDSQESR